MDQRLQVTSRFKNSMLLGISILALLALTVACEIGPGASQGALEIPSDREPNAAVSGTVMYRERIALTPGASLVVELRDVSLADAAAPLNCAADHCQSGSGSYQFQGGV